MPAPTDRTKSTTTAGRPRDTHIDAAVLDAALALLGESGYHRFSIENTARRAGTTKPAVYRRWASRQQLVLAVLARQLGEVSAPDTDCTLCDISECINLYVQAFERMPPDVLGPLLADCTGSPRLRDEFMSTLFDPPRAAVEGTLDRALARGDLRTDLDRPLTLDLLGSLVHYRALFGHASTSEQEVESAVETLLRGIATDYPSLLAHARAQDSASRAHPLHTD
ncbi:TetR/AcrR family transcriptional regulator [Saccharopolyspora sp. HNM0983]|uniref:TetR/AcrR family transcriptional regulator n=1 Tax=Saccharopolyspora montiporae TaxID=2781240 RepID=A0A929B680_9PSEU|nr:TetR/AcrR family transcriptional regulator [Saccharopolyspora sp. HNM0983]MBE9373924.1 TetR/AcrR family transcriptional regulator [Saccharopolyspora sp. HNM0983]